MACTIYDGNIGWGIGFGLIVLWSGLNIFESGLIAHRSGLIIFGSGLIAHRSGLIIFGSGLIIAYSVAWLELLAHLFYFFRKKTKATTVPWFSIL